MGGGDLNTKKTWHPSTLKNQERVWKAEQAAAEEQKRILELQRERAQERDREELNKLSRESSDQIGASDKRLSWMYDQKPDKKVQQEDYLLGKTIDKNYDNAGSSEQYEIPAVSRRVVGSSMITTGGDTQVDLARKLREDPLLLVKERERAARAALLNNPVQRKKLTEMLRKEQEQKNQLKSEKISKKKNIDDLLTAKLNALGGEKNLNIANLLASDDSSDSEKEKASKKKKKKDKSKKHKQNSDSESPVRKKKSREFETTKRSGNDSDTEVSIRNSTSKHNFTHDSKHDNNPRNIKYSKDEGDNTESYYKKKYRDYSHPSKSSEGLQRHNRESSSERKNSRRDPNLETRKRNWEPHRQRNKGLSEEEKSARLAQMAAAGAEREVERGQRVAAQLAENAAAEKSRPHHSSRASTRALPDSLESRIHSNRHYIQRDKQHMNEHFARR